MPKTIRHNLRHEHVRLHNLQKRYELQGLDYEKFKLAVDNSSDHIVITSPEGIVIYANRGMERMTGYKRGEVLGKKAGSHELWGGYMPKAFYVKMWRTIKVNKETFRGEVKNRRKNGEFYRAQISIAPVLNRKRQIMFFVGTEHDITEERRIEETKSEFVSLASHQLRTPLSAINWYVELLLDGESGRLNREQLQALRAICHASQRMVQLVNSLLNVSRIEMGKLIVEPRKVKLQSLMPTILKDIIVLAEKNHRSFSYSVSQFPATKLDVNLFGIAIQNLLSNAVKYTSPGGQVYLNISMQGQKLKIVVKDDGCGIPVSEQRHIFKKLYRANNARMIDPEGTGLGLFITKSIVETAGGTISFRSKQNKGTTFTVLLPASGMQKRAGTKSVSVNQVLI